MVYTIQSSQSIKRRNPVPASTADPVEITSLASGSAPSLVLATTATVTLSDGTTLSEGNATVVDGDVSLAMKESTAVAAIATIGEEVPLGDGAAGDREEADPSSAATPSTEAAEPQSSVSILVEANDCSNGDPFTWEGCTPLEGVLFSLARAEETCSSETGQDIP
jgi:hypothetical protein